MACQNETCGCGRCQLSNGCSASAVRLTTEQQPAAARASGECPTFFADHYAEEREGKKGRQQSGAPVPSVRAGAASASPDGGESDEQPRRTACARPAAAWSARRAGPTGAALALVGLAFGGGIIKHVWQNR